jgi:hypothetical protein
VRLDGEPIALQRAAVGPWLTLLLCGDVEAWQIQPWLRSADLLRVVYLSSRPAPGVVVDEDGSVLSMLGVRDAAQYLVRPDGYLAFRCAGRDLGALEQYLIKWYRRGS